MAGGTIFLNYRRDDSEGYVGRLYDHLSLRFPDRVFRDVTNLRPGEDFVDALQREGLHCQVLLAVIGRHWLTVTGANGQRRLDDSNDILRQEIARALQRNICVIPVLVGGANMPQKEELPPDLTALWRRQALPITERDFVHDMDQLIQAIEEALGEPSRKKELGSQQDQSASIGTHPAQRGKPLRWIIGSVLATIVVLAVIGSLTTSDKANTANEKAPIVPVQPTSLPSPVETSTPTTGNEEEKAFLKEMTSSMVAIKSWRDRIRNIRTEPTDNPQQMQSRARRLLSALDSYDQQLNSFAALLQRADGQGLVTTDEDRHVVSILEQICDVWIQQSTRIRYEAQVLVQYDPYNTSPYDLQVELQTIEREINALDVRSVQLLQ
ncbi:MAG TPA: toll/interleukin-1 receptor domain-containing protein, partial [Alphaproteobacteria bacterium]|nr:toll/interleukin-1 receptor domain-containing protein [Alphaproteobacteria bacterium]